jgi:hypothetical protein
MGLVSDFSVNIAHTDTGRTLALILSRSLQPFPISLGIKRFSSFRFCRFRADRIYRVRNQSTFSDWIGKAAPAECRKSLGIPVTSNG